MKLRSLIPLVCAFALPAAHAGTLGVDPISGSAGLVSGYGGLTLGWEFQITAPEGITLDGLAFWDDASDGFLFGQTFDVGIWDAATATLLRETVVTSASALMQSLSTPAGWRVNQVTPVYLPPGLYRIGALMPVSGANKMIASGASYHEAAGITVTRFMRQLGSPTLAMPDTGGPTLGSTYFGPSFTFMPGVVVPPTAVVAPSAYANTLGNGGLNTLVRNSGYPRTYQMQFSPAVLAGLPVGAKITGLRFRLNTNNVPVSGFPSVTTTWSDYEVTLAQAAHTIPSMSSYFADNMVAPVLVKIGALSIGVNNFTTDTPLNPFCPFLTFDVPYVYQGGDLVMLFRHPGSDSLTLASYLDGVTTSTPGYGTTFRAFSANSFTATAGSQYPLTIAQILFTYPLVETISRDGNNIVIAGTGGTSGGTYHLLTTTDTTTPTALWESLASGTFDTNGRFRFTNTITPDLPARFFRIVTP